MALIRFFPLIFILARALIVERPITQIQWCGAAIIYTRDDETIPQFQGLDDEKTIFFMTEAHSIYQSNGTVWQKIEGQFDDILISPADSRVVFLIGQQGGKSFRTNNCGETFEEIETEGFYSFKLNKMNWMWLLAFKRQTCDNFDMDCREPYNNQLFYSEDGGKTWLPSFKNCREVSWDKILDEEEVPDQRTIVLLSKDNQTQLAYSDDFSNYRTLMIGAQGYYQTPKYLFILSSSDKGAYELHYGKSNLDKYEQQLVELPLQILKEYSYTVLDTDNGRIYLSVSHQQQEQSITNVYISNQLGQDFQIVLTNNVRSTQDGNCDFEKLLGLTSTYVANTYDFKDQEYKTTVISFDGGKKWESIKAPKVDSEGNIIECGGDCSLHFIGRTESYRQTIYTVEQAPGIVLGVGNVGLYIAQEQNTYMSADGGQHWIEVSKGSHVFEIADFGGVIVMAKDFEPTNEIIYSTDYGKSWKTKIIYDDLFMVQNLVSEASGTVRYFLLYGKTDTGDGIIIKLDFSDTFKRDCRANLDYDIWDSKCIEGSQTKYYRRKPQSECFNPKLMITKKIIEPCPCKREDWICAPGYVNHTIGGECSPLINISNYCEPGKSYYKSQGYAKLTQCMGGLDLGPVEEYCPIVIDFQMILLVIVAGILLVVIFIFAYQTIRKMFVSQNKPQPVNQYNQMEFQDDEDDDEHQL